MAETGLSDRRIRRQLGRARIRDRYRAALWEARLTLRNATILGFRTIGFDHREEVAWHEGPPTRSASGRTLRAISTVWSWISPSWPAAPSS